VPQLQTRYVEVVGRSTGSSDKAYWLGGYPGAAGDGLRSAARPEMTPRRRHDQDRRHSRARAFLPTRRDYALRAGICAAGKRLRFVTICKRQRTTAVLAESSAHSAFRTNPASAGFTGVVAT
jgi:hypothetical protein